MAVAWEFTESDERPFFAIVVKNRLTNQPVDLTGTTVTFFMKEQSARPGATPKVNGGACVLTDAANGEVEYRWGASDLDTPGVYDVIFKVEHTDTKDQSVHIRGVVVHPKYEA